MCRTHRGPTQHRGAHSPRPAPQASSLSAQGARYKRAWNGHCTRKVTLSSAVQPPELLFARPFRARDPPGLRNIDA